MVPFQPKARMNLCEVRSLNEKPSYQAEVVSLQHLDADWSRRRGEEILIGRYVDPHLHRAQQGVQYTRGGLKRIVEVSQS